MVVGGAAKSVTVLERPAAGTCGRMVWDFPWKERYVALIVCRQVEQR